MGRDINYYWRTKLLAQHEREAYEDRSSDHCEGVRAMPVEECGSVGVGVRERRYGTEVIGDSIASQQAIIRSQPAAGQQPATPSQTSQPAAAADHKQQSAMVWTPHMTHRLLQGC